MRKEMERDINNVIWLTSKELCSYLGISYSGIRGLTLKAELPSHVVGRDKRYNRCEIDNWIVSGRSAYKTNRKTRSKKA